MPDLGDIFKRYAPEYLEKHKAKILPRHIRAIHDIINCRTGKFGYHIDRCTECGERHLFFHSCCSRNCPKCHSGKTQKWIERKTPTLLPVNYFHVVFTLPQELRFIVRSNQKALYNCLFKAATYALFKLMADPRFGGGIPGMIGVLHTWSRIMDYHPHVHFLIPAGVISKDRSEWLPIKKKFLVPISMLSTIFRARFMKIARKELPGFEFPQSVWKKQWVVYTKCVDYNMQKPQTVLNYLARYIFKIAITNNRIVADNDGKITFKYQDSKTNEWKRMTLPAHEFMRRFLQHVLPLGFHKVRTYGFLTHQYKEAFLSLKLQLQKSEEEINYKSDIDKGEDYYRRCPKCKKGRMVVIVHIFYQKDKLFLVRPPPCKE
jgi:ssDNA-binding Zn-finger/Zn-ribbon topoisomerase 1